MSIVEPRRRTPILAKVDVVVAGGGPAGFGAAVAAARNGANTILVEKFGFLGGGYTAQGVIAYHLDKTAPMPQFEEKKPLIGGIAQESVERMVEMRGTFPPSLYAKYVGNWRAYIPFDPELLKICMMEMVEESGAKQILHSLAVDAVVEDDVVKGVIIESKSGRQAILADVVVDCTGDGDVAAAAGAPWERLGTPRTDETIGDKHLLPFNLVATLGGIDYEKAKEITPAFMQELTKKARQANLPASRDRPGRPSTPILPHFGSWGTDFIKIPDWEKYWQRKGEVLIHLPGYWGDCSNAEDLTKGEIEDRKKILPIIDFVRKNMPGFEECYLMYTFPQTGVRESRRIMGDYVIKWEEDVEKCLRHEDVICQARPMMGPAFDIPYRALTPRNIEGLLTAGRCISHAPFPMETWKIALRDEIQCTGIGEAAGAAAALAVKQRVHPRKVDIPSLQEILKRQGLNLER